MATRARNLGVLSVSLVGDADQFQKTMALAVKAIDLFNKRVQTAAKGTAKILKTSGITPKDLTAAFQTQSVEAITSSITALSNVVQRLTTNLADLSKAERGVLQQGMRAAAKSAQTASKSIKDLRFNTKAAFDEAKKVVSRGSPFGRDLFSDLSRGKAPGGFTAKAFERITAAGRFTVAEINKPLRAIVVDRKKIVAQLEKVDAEFARLEAARLEKVRQGALTEDAFQRDRIAAEKKRLDTRTRLATALQKGQLGGVLLTAEGAREQLSDEQFRRAQQAGSLFTEVAGQLVKLDESVARVARGSGAAIAEFSTAAAQKLQVLPDSLQRVFDKFDRFTGRAATQLEQLRSGLDKVGGDPTKKSALETKIAAAQVRLVQLSQAFEVARLLPFGAGQQEAQRTLGGLQEEASQLRGEIKALTGEHRNLGKEQKDNFGSILRLSNLFRVARGEGGALAQIFRNLANEVDFTLGAIAGFAVARAILNSFIATVRNAVGAFPAFEDELRKVQAIIEASDEELQSLSQEVLRLSANSIISATEGARALQILGQAGLSAGESIAALEPLFAISIGGVASLEDSAQLATSILRAFRLEASELEGVANTLVATVNKSKASIEDLNIAFNFAGATAAGANQEFADLAAVTGVLADQGVRASTQGTTFRRVIGSFLDPTSKALDVFQALGLSIEDLNPLTNDLGTILTRLRDNGFDLQDAFLAFDERIAVSANLLVQSAEHFQRLRESITGTTAAFDAMETRQKSLVAQTTILGNRIQNLAIAFGKDLAAPLALLIHGLNALASSSSVAADAISKLGTVMGIIVGTGVLATLIAGLRTLATTLHLFTKSNFVIGGILTAGAALLAFWGRWARQAAEAATAMRQLGERHQKYGLVIAQSQETLTKNFLQLERSLAAGETSSTKYATAQANILDELNRLILRAPEAADEIVALVNAMATDRVDNLREAFAALNTELGRLSVAKAAEELERDIAQLERRRTALRGEVAKRALGSILSGVPTGGAPIGLPPEAAAINAKLEALERELAIKQAQRAQVRIRETSARLIREFTGTLTEDPQNRARLQTELEAFAAQMLTDLDEEFSKHAGKLSTLLVEQVLGLPKQLPDDSNVFAKLGVTPENIHQLRQVRSQLEAIERQLTKPTVSGEAVAIDKAAAKAARTRKEIEQTNALVESTGLPEQAAKKLSEITHEAADMARGLQGAAGEHRQLLVELAKDLPKTNSLEAAAVAAEATARKLHEVGGVRVQGVVASLGRLAQFARDSQAEIDQLVAKAETKTAGRIRNEQEESLRRQFEATREGLVRQAATTTNIQRFEQLIAEIAERRLATELAIADTKTAEEAAIERASILATQEFLTQDERRKTLEDIAHLQAEITKTLQAQAKAREELDQLELDRQRLRIESGEATRLFGGQGRAALEAELERKRILFDLAAAQRKLVLGRQEEANLIRQAASADPARVELAKDQVREKKAELEVDQARIELLQEELRLARESGDVFINLGDSVQTLIQDVFEGIRTGGLKTKDVLTGVWQSFAEQGIAAFSKVLVEKIEFDKTFNANIFKLAQNAGGFLASFLPAGAKAGLSGVLQTLKGAGQFLPTPANPGAQEADFVGPPTPEQAAEARAFDAEQGTAQLAQLVVSLIGLVTALVSAGKQIVSGMKDVRKATRGDKQATQAIGGIGAGIIAATTAAGAAIGAPVFGIGAIAGAALGALVGTIIVKSLTKGVVAGINKSTKGGLTQRELEGAVATELTFGIFGESFSKTYLRAISGGLFDLLIPNIETIFDKILADVIAAATNLPFNRQLKGRLGAGLGPGGAARAQDFFGRGGPAREEAQTLARLIGSLAGASTGVPERLHRFFELLANNAARFGKSLEEAREYIYEITRTVVGGGGSFAQAFRFLEKLLRPNTARLTGAFTQAAKLIGNAFRDSFPTLDVDRVVELYTQGKLGRIGDKAFKRAQKALAEAADAFTESEGFDVAFADFVGTLKAKIKDSVIGGFVDAFILQGPIGGALNGFLGQVNKLIKKAAKKGDFSPETFNEILKAVNFQAVLFSELLAAGRDELERMFALIQEVEEVIEEIITTPIQREQERLTLLKQTFDVIFEAAQAVFETVQRTADLRARLTQKIFAGTTGAETIPQAPGITEIFRDAMGVAATEFHTFVEGLTPEALAGQEDSLLALAESFEQSIDAWLDAAITGIQDVLEPAIRLATQAASALKTVTDSIRSITLSRSDLAPSEKLATIDAAIEAQRRLMLSGTPEQQLEAAEELQRLLNEKLETAATLLDTSGPVYRALVDNVTGELTALGEFLDAGFGDAEDLQALMEEQIRLAREEAAGHYDYIQDTIGPFLLSAEERAQKQLDALVSKLKQILGVDESASLASVLGAIPQATADALTTFLEQAGIITAGGNPDDLDATGGGATTPPAGIGDEKVGQRLKNRVRTFFGDDEFTVPAEGLRNALNHGLLALFSGLTKPQQQEALVPLQGVIGALAKITIPTPTDFKVVAAAITWLRNRLGELGLPFLDTHVGLSDPFGKAIFERLATYLGIDPNTLVSVSAGLKTGGVVMRPTFRALGEAGPEVVLPLQGPVLRQVADTLLQAMYDQQSATVDRLTTAATARTVATTTTTNNVVLQLMPGAIQTTVNGGDPAALEALPRRQLDALEHAMRSGRLRRVIQGIQSGVL